jgi:hypothetical protein
MEPVALRRWWPVTLFLVVAAITGAPGHELAGATAANATETSDCPPATLPLDVRLRPDHGPVGTRVHISGRCFRRRWRHEAFGLFLAKDFRHPRECELMVGAERLRLTVDADRRAHGVFDVGSSGQCFQQQYRRQATPGVYSVGIYCHACSFSQFRVTRD